MERKDIVFQYKFKKPNGDTAVEYSNEICETRVKEYLQIEMAAEVGIPCVLTFGTYRQNKRHTLTTYGYCKGKEYNPNHPDYRFVIENLKKEQVLVYLYTTETNFNIEDVQVHKGPVQHSQLRGHKRELAKEEMRDCSAMQYYDRLNSNIDRNLCHLGNYGDLQDPKIFQQANYEKRPRKLTIKINDMHDIYQRTMKDAKLADPYLRFAGTPFQVIMFSEKQFLVSAGSKIAYFDATSHVCRKPDPYCHKKVFYHTLVIKKHNTVLPVIEMLCINQDQDTIGDMFGKYKQFVNNKLKKKLPWTTVVTDWCHAAMNALLKELNLMNMLGYLKTTHHFLKTKGATLPKDFVSIQSCISHFQHRIARKIKQNFPSLLPHKALMLNFTGLLIRCTKLDQLNKVFRLICIVLCTTDVHTSAKAIDELKAMYESMSMKENEDYSAQELREKKEEQEQENQPEERKEKRTVEEKAMYTKSPYYVDGYDILSGVQKTVPIDENNKTNELYNPGYADYILEKYITYAPVWSGIILSVLHKGLKTESNANIEGYNGQLKGPVLNNNGHNPVGNFCEIMRRHKEVLCNRIETKGNYKNST